MKYLLRGFFLGIALIFFNKICCITFDGLNVNFIIAYSAILFFTTTVAFLTVKKFPGVFVCGFCGLITMFLGEILFCMHTEDFIDKYFDSWIYTYVGGFYGSTASIPIALIITASKTDLFQMGQKENINMNDALNKNLKIKLLIYAVVSAMSFSYLVLPEKASISVPIFVAIQFGSLWFIAPTKKNMMLFIPIFIMSLNCFFSSNTIWRIPNLAVCAVLYTCMFMNFKMNSDNLKCFGDMFSRMFQPITYFDLPFKWSLEFNTEKAPTIKRTATAIVIAIPCVLLLTLILANADMVFSLKASNFATRISDAISIANILKMALGALVGLYLFGLLYNAHTQYHIAESHSESKKGDLIIINIILCAILFVYTFFVIIQFKYLFAGATLPAGLTYTEYARKGFFELLGLTGVNVAVILIVTAMTKVHNSIWKLFSQMLCHYLCAITIILLISSFYRMMLYTNDDGLTRLRFFVMGFLVFEAIGLLITFIYIAKPKFNIVLIYSALALIYYTILNIVPTDNIIAQNQINKYLSNQREGLEYIFTLSADTAPAMEYLYHNTDDEQLKTAVVTFLEDKTSSEIPERWQRYNFATHHAQKLYEQICDPSYLDVTNHK